MSDRNYNLETEKSKTFFSCNKVQFPVVEDSKIDTLLFLDAAKKLVGLVGKNSIVIIL